MQEGSWASIQPERELKSGPGSPEFPKACLVTFMSCRSEGQPTALEDPWKLNSNAPMEGAKNRREEMQAQPPWRLAHCLRAFSLSLTSSSLSGEHWGSQS